MYVARAWDAGTPPAEAMRLRELYAAVAARERAEANSRQMQKLLADRQARINALVAKVDADLGRPATIPTHKGGAPAAVVVLYRARPHSHQPDYTPIDVNTGHPLIYPTITAAAKAMGIRKPDNICQAIRRGGACGGWAFQYLADSPVRHLCAILPNKVKPPSKYRRQRDPVKVFLRAVLEDYRRNERQPRTPYCREPIPLPRLRHFIPFATGAHRRDY